VEKRSGEETHTEIIERVEERFGDLEIDGFILFCVLSLKVFVTI